MYIHTYVRTCMYHSHLVFFQPLLNELLLALCKHGPAQLQGLVLVQLAGLQEDAKVLQQGGGLARGRGHLLEPLDGLGRAQDALWKRMYVHVCISISIKTCAVSKHAVQLITKLITHQTQLLMCMVSTEIQNVLISRTHMYM